MSDVKLSRFRSAITTVRDSLDQGLGELRHKALLQDANRPPARQTATTGIDPRLSRVDLATRDYTETPRVTFPDALQIGVWAQYKPGLLGVYGANRLTQMRQRCVENPQEHLCLNIGRNMCHSPKGQSGLAQLCLVGVRAAGDRRAPGRTV